MSMNSLKRNRLIAGVITMVVIIGGVALSISQAPMASAHGNSILAKCANMRVLLSNYATRQGKTNHVKVTVDGTAVADTDFGSSYDQSFAYNQYVAHDLAVKVTAWDDSRYNVNWSYTTTACAKPDQPPANKRDHVTTGDCHVATLDHVYEEQAYIWDTDKYVLGDWRVIRTDHFANSLYPCPKPPKVVPPGPKHFTPRIRVRDLCRCKHDSVKVFHSSAIQFASVKQVSKTKWVVRLVAEEGYVLPVNIKHSNSGWAGTVKYTFHTTNKPCPCEVTGCKAKPKPKPPVPSCACRD